MLARKVLVLGTKGYQTANLYFCRKKLECTDFSMMNVNERTIIVISELVYAGGH